MIKLPSLRAKRSKLSLIILALLLILNSKFSILTAQEPFYMPDGAYIEQMLIIEGDTVYAIMPDTVGLYAINGKYFLTTVDFVEQYVAAHSGSGSVDSFYLSSTGQWITLGDTIPKDTIYYTLTIRNSSTSNDSLYVDGGIYQYASDEGGMSQVLSITSGNINAQGLTLNGVNPFTSKLDKYNDDTVLYIIQNGSSFTRNKTAGIFRSGPFGKPLEIIAGTWNSSEYTPTADSNNAIVIRIGGLGYHRALKILNTVNGDSLIIDEYGKLNFYKNGVSSGALDMGITHIPTVPSVLGTNPDSSNFVLYPLNTFDRFIATYAVTGNDTLGGSSSGNAIDIVTQYQWINCRTSANTWGNYTANNFTYDNDTLQYTGTSEALYPGANLTLGGTSNAYEFRWYNVTDAAELPGSIIFTPVAYPTPLYLSAYDVNADTNDRYVLQVRCLTGTSDLSLYKGFIEIKNK